MENEGCKLRTICQFCSAELCGLWSLSAGLQFCYRQHAAREQPRDYPYIITYVFPTTWPVSMYVRTYSRSFGDNKILFVAMQYATASLGCPQASDDEFKARSKVSQLLIMLPTAVK